MSINNIVDQLRRDEGFRSSAYQDHLGYWTIGVGRQIDSRKGGGISRDEAMLLLQNDIEARTAQLEDRLPWFVYLSATRQGVLINMAFQLGIGGLMNFKKTLAHVEAGQYTAAASEMLQSTWAKQTPERAERLATQMRTGVWQ